MSYTSHTTSGGNGYYAAMVMAASNYGNEGNSYKGTHAQPQKQRHSLSDGMGYTHATTTVGNGPVYGATTTAPTTTASMYSNAHQNQYHSPNHSATHNPYATAGQHQQQQQQQQQITAPAPQQHVTPAQNASLNPSANVSALSASFSSTTSVGGTKRYRHNPYGSTSEPNTPTLAATGTAVSPPFRLTNPPAADAGAAAPVGAPTNNTSLPSSHGRHGSSHNTSVESNGSYPARQTSFGPMGGPNGSGSYSCETSSTNPNTPSHAAGGTTANVDVNALSVVEQFTANVGNLCALACTMRGRHILVGIMRQQNERLQVIFNELGPNVGALALDPQGCHVVRSLLDYTSDEQNQHIAQCLSPAQVVDIATNNQHSRRILQTLFERYQGVGLDGVVMTIAKEASALAATQQGCITVMRVVENGLPHQRQMILEALVPTMAKLTMDPYGNYVVQAILDHTDAATINRVVIHAYRGHWLVLSCNKFASNVMEKVVRTVSGEARQMLLQELVMSGDGATINTLVHDGYGNFVIQAIIDSAAGPEEVARLAERIRPVLSTSPYAHRIEARLKGGVTGAGPAHQRHNNAQRNKTAGASNGANGAQEREREHRAERRGNHNHHPNAEKERGERSERSRRYEGRYTYNSGSSSGVNSASGPSSNQPTSSSNASSHEGHGVSPHVPHSRRGGR